MSDPASSSEQKKLIDLHQQLKNPALRLLAPVLERTFGISEFNERYVQATSHKTGRNFFDHALHILGINYVISAEDRDRIPQTGPLVIVANHPHGGSDALAVGSLLVSVRSDVKFLANYLTGIMPELDPYFFYVDPFSGSAAVKSNIGPLKQSIKHLKAGGCVCTFPSGTVSHLHLLKRRVTDPLWTSNIAAIARLTQATIIPIYIDGRNTDWFQLAGLIHPRLRTALLIREMMNQQGRSLELRVGQPIPPARMAKFKSDEEATEYLRLKTYILGNRDKTERRHRFIKMPRLIWGKTEQEPLATPTDPAALEAEIKSLPPDKLLVNHGEMSVYICDYDNIPVVMREIGLLRERTFRAVGEGTGKPLDIDEYDAYYMHLFIWNSRTREIVGGYRLGRTDRIISMYGAKGMYTSSLFHFKDQLLERLSPALEMGRSYIREEYQRKPNALPLLWRGIGEYVARHQQYRVLFGPVSISSDYKPLSRELMVQYLRNNSVDEDLKGYVRARRPPHARNMEKIDKNSLRSTIKDIEDISELVSDIETDRKGVPVLLRHYLKLNATILSFNVDKDFSNVIDGLIVVDLMRTEPKILRRFMGDESMAQFTERHNRTEAAVATE